VRTGGAALAAWTHNGYPRTGLDGAWPMPDDAPTDVPGPAGAAAAPPPVAGDQPGSTEPSTPGFLDRLPWWTVPALLIGVPLLVGVVAQAVPSFYHGVVWRYYWGPIKADAMDCALLSDLRQTVCAGPSSPGVLAHSGYNVVNTLSWAGLLGVCILGLAQMLNAFRTPMDDKLIVGATAWVVVGSVVHVLEDTGLLRPPLQYFFITPPIYLVFGAFGVASFLVGQWMRRVAARTDLHVALRLLWFLHIVLVLGYFALWAAKWPLIVHYVNPVLVAAFAGVNFLVTRWAVLRKGAVDPSQLTLTLSFGTYLMAGALVADYIRTPWTEPPGDGMWYAFLLAPVFAALLAGLVWLLAKRAPKAILGVLLVGAPILAGVAALTVAQLLLKRTGAAPGLEAALQTPTVGAAVVVVVAAATAWKLWKDHKGQADTLTAQTAVAYALAINVLLVFSQMLDAFATALGIDLRGYTEKHVLSGGVIAAFRSFAQSVHWDWGAAYPTFLAFAPVKLLVSLLVVYAIDVQSQEDARRHPTMIGLVKFAIIMVGIGPGVRDFTRLSLGV